MQLCLASAHAETSRRRSSYQTRQEPIGFDFDQRSIGIWCEQSEHDPIAVHVHKTLKMSPAMTAGVSKTLYQ
jgi:hypothetical protein